MCTHTPQRKHSVTDSNFRIKQRKFPCRSVDIFHRGKKNYFRQSFSGKVKGMDILKLTASQLVYKNGKLSQSQKIAKETHLGNNIDTDTILEKLLVSRRETHKQKRQAMIEIRRMRQNTSRALPELHLTRRRLPWRLRW